MHLPRNLDTLEASARDGYMPVGKIAVPEDAPRQKLPRGQGRTSKLWCVNTVDSYPQ